MPQRVLNAEEVWESVITGEKVCESTRKCETVWRRMRKCTKNVLKGEKFAKVWNCKKKCKKDKKQLRKCAKCWGKRLKQEEEYFYTELFSNKFHFKGKKTQNTFSSKSSMKTQNKSQLWYIYFAQNINFYVGIISIDWLMITVKKIELQIILNVQKTIWSDHSY